MWDVKACRGCLSTKLKLEKAGASSRRIYSTITSLEFPDGDGYPKYLCIECSAMIRKFISFRRKCRRAHFVLKEIMAVKKQVSLRSIESVDRKRTNLCSQYDNANNVNQCVYMLTDPENDPCENSDYNINIEGQLENNSNVKEINDNREKELTKCNLFNANNNSFIITDIKPDNYVETEEEKPTVIVEDDFRDESPENNEEHLNDIDLEDVFKGLPENEESEAELSEPEVFRKPMEVEEKKKKILIEKSKKMVEKKDDKLKNIWTESLKRHCASIAKVKQTCEILMMYKIRLLSHKEQVEAHLRKLEDASYKLASFKCSICVKAFVDKSLLMVHTALHSKSASWRYKCKVCKIAMQTQEHLLEHMCDTHLYEYQCSICKYTTNSVAKVGRCAQHSIAKPIWIQAVVQRHFKKEPLPEDQYVDTIKEVTGCGSHVCPDCNYAFVTQNAFVAHRNQHDIARRSIYPSTCDVCKITLLDVTTLREHMESAHMYSYTCKHCDVVVMNSIQAQSHECTSHTPSTCLVCHRYCKNIVSLVEHQTKKHHKFKQPGDNWCHLCGQLYNSRYALYHHQLTYHEFLSFNDVNAADYSNICKECEVNFVSSDAHLTHFSYKPHKNNPVKTCERCQTKFIGYGKLDHTCYGIANDHIYFGSGKPPPQDFPPQPKERKKPKSKVPPNKNTPKPCSYCDAVLSNTFAYKRHFSTEHPGLPYKHCGEYGLCHECGKSVSLKKMSAHKRGHLAGVNVAGVPLRCPHCDGSVMSRRELVWHVLRHHTDRPFLCALCPARYHRRIKCFDHILKTHAPERPFPCPVCGRHFAHRAFVRIHARRAHNINVRTAPRAKAGLYLYPHMKLNCTLIEPELIESLPLQVCDYLDRNMRPVDNYLDYAIFDPAQIPPETVTSPNKRKTDESQETTTRKKKKINIDDRKEDNDSMALETEASTTKTKKKKRVILTDDEGVTFVDKSRLNFEQIVVTSGKSGKLKKASNFEIIEDVKFDGSMCNDDYGLTTLSGETDDLDDEIVSNDEAKTEIAPQDNYEVIEDGSNQYVMIDGVLYRIEPT